MKTKRFFSLLLAALITIGMLFTVYQGEYVGPRERPKVRQKIKMKTLRKSFLYRIENQVLKRRIINDKSPKF